MSIDRIRTAAENLQSALADYDPGSMRQMVRDLPAVGEALGQVGDGVRSVAARAEDQWPTAAAVTDGLYSMAGDLQAAAQTADVAQSFGTHHGADIERHDAPRGGSRAAESRWDVSRADTDDDGGSVGRHQATEVKEPTVATPSVPPPAARAHAGGFDPRQPRAADGKWIKVGDALGYADDETCFGTDRVTGTGRVPTDLALIEYPPERGMQSGAFVSVATPKGSFNPVTGKEDGGHIYCAPQLDAGEAETAAARLEELASMVESGYRPPTPTRHTRARQRIELLLQEDRAGRRDRIGVGDEEDFPLNVGELLKLLSEADPTLSAPQTRHAVRAHAAGAAGGEDGTVWLDIEPDATGQMHVVVIAVEGTESPDDEYNRQYAAHHTPDSARELAGKLRAFALAARKRARTRTS